MSPERWEQIQKLFDRARACEPGERAALLDGACRGDEELRSEIEWMLAHQEEAKNFIHAPALEQAAMSVAADCSIPIGRKLGSYEITALLGKGGMGEVYRARDVKLKRDVALKILPGEFHRDPDRIRRFQREAEALASLNHPNIAAIYDFQETSGFRFLIMELVEGESLDSRVAKGPLRVNEALNIAKQICEALEAAHDKGIVHRDLKPANVKITFDGKVKVLDFGLAKALAGGACSPDLSQLSIVTAKSTRDGMILGTPAYLSPEQARGKQLDKRTDIWAFGCVLFELLTGRKAFAGETVSDTIAKILEREPDLQKLSEVVPSNVRVLLRRCMEKERNRRLHDIADARIELEDALNSATRVDATGTHSFETKRIVLASLAVGIVFGAVGTWIGMSRLGRAGVSSPVVARFTIDLPQGAVLESGFGTQLAISPDGSRVAFSVTRASQTEMFVRRIDELAAKPVEGIKTLAGGGVRFFSPDGQWLGYVDPASRSIKKVALSGGAPVTMVTIEGRQGNGGTWGAEDNIIYADVDLYEVPASGGAPSLLLKPDTAKGERAYRGPLFLPGGKAVLFTISNEDNESHDDATIAVLDLTTGHKKILVQGGMDARYSPSGHLVYARAGSLLAVPFDLKRLEIKGRPVRVLDGVLMSTNTGIAQFTIASNGTLVYAPGKAEGGERVPVWVDSKGKATPLPVPRRSYLHPALSPDEKQLAIEVEGPSHNLYSYDLSRGTFTKLTFDGLSHWPLWTPRGDRLTFRKMTIGLFTMWWMAADRSAPEQQLSSIGGAMESPSSWSPDGHALAFTRVDLKTGPDVYILPMDGDRKPRPLAQSRFAEGSPKFSPDGRWVAYSSNESGKPEIYVQPYPGPGPTIQISTEGGTDPVWSKKNHEIFYRNGDRMMLVAIKTQPKFSASKPELLWMGHYSHGLSSSCGLPGPTSANYDVTADGKRFLMIQDADQDVVAHQLNVVLNWSEELNRLGQERKF
jgi:eukaryotic-like serine/threonine-protein kinase